MGSDDQRTELSPLAQQVHFLEQEVVRLRASEWRLKEENARLRVVVNQAAEKPCLRKESFADGNVMTCLDYWPDKPEMRCENCNAKAVVKEASRV